MAAGEEEVEGGKEKIMWVGWVVGNRTEEAGLLACSPVREVHAMFHAAKEGQTHRGCQKLENLLVRAAPVPRINSQRHRWRLSNAKSMFG